MRVAMDAATVSRTRFAPSPAHETYGWLTHAFTRERHPVAGNLGASARSALTHPDVRLLGQVVEGALRARYVPNFLLRPPVADERDGHQVERLAERWATSDEDQVRTELAHLVRFQPPDARVEYRRRIDRSDAARWLARGFTRVWTELVRTEWQDIRALLRTDVARRGEAWLAGGVATVLDDLHPSLSWRGDALVVDSAWDETFDVVDAVVTFVPSTTTRGVLAQVCVPDDRWLSYPAAVGDPVRGTGAGRALDELLGGTRATVLRRLVAPGSTAELSEALGLAPATVSHHLHVLLRADLVTRRRSGHKILYTQSSKAARLLRTGASESVWPV